MQKITPFLWFDHQTEDAAEKTGRPVGSVVTVEFEIDGQKFMDVYDFGQT